MAADNTAAREAYYAKVARLDVSPLWTTRLVPPRPADAVRSVPHLWDFDNVIRPALIEAGGLITAQEANRRVLSLENPGLGGSHRVLELLYAGVQMIMPGECAPAHKHSPAALRFILEGQGDAWTAVAGEKSIMRPGDFIITPSDAWHDHGHDGEGPYFWLDGLDIPMVATFGAMFFDHYPADRAPQSRPDRRQPGALWRQHAARQRALDAAGVADLLLPLRALACGTGEAARGAGVGPVRRPQADLHRSDHRRQRDADHLDLPATAAQGVRDTHLPHHGERDLLARGRPWPADRRRGGRGTHHSRSSRAISCACRAGCRTASSPTTNACCSASPIASLRRSWACGGRCGGMRR